MYKAKDPNNIMNKDNPPGPWRSPWLKGMLVIVGFLMVAAVPLLAHKAGGFELPLLKLNDEPVKARFKSDYSVSAVALSPDGRYVASSGLLSRTINVWDIQKKKLAYELPREWSPDVGGMVKAIAWSPDGRYLASARGFLRATNLNNQVAVNIWEAKTGNLARTIFKPAVYEVSDGVSTNALVFSPDGRFLAVGYSRNKAAKGNIYIYDVATWAVVKVLEPLVGHGSTLTYSPDGKFLAYGGHTLKQSHPPTPSKKEAIFVHSVETGEIVTTIQEVMNTRDDDSTVAQWIESVAYSPDGKYIVSGGTRGIVIYDASSGKPIMPPAEHRVYSVIYRPDGNHIISADSGKTVSIWSVQSGNILKTLKGHKNIVFLTAVSHDGKTLAAGGENSVTVWDIGQITEVR